MSAAPGETAPANKLDAEALVLRHRPRPVVRFRRGLIIGITATVSAAVIAVTWLALEPPSFHFTSDSGEDGEPLTKAPADALANVPANYADVPRLGPPLPGDLGRPILEHQRGLGMDPAEPVPPERSDDVGGGAEAARERLAAELEAARRSPVAVQLRAPPVPPHAAALGSVPDTEQELADAGAPESAPIPRPSVTSPKSPSGTLNENHIVEAASPWVLTAGTAIPASLLTGLNSDLPGMVLAQVTENVRDSATGRTILVPQGSRLFGRYDNRVAYGQKRALLVWQRIVFPDGSAVELDNAPAADTAGYSGVSDEVDFHTWRLLKGIAMSTLLGVGTQVSLGGDGDLVRAVREATQQNASRAGEQITIRNLDVQPTLRVRPGYRLLAVINKDLVLRPWKGSQP